MTRDDALTLLKKAGLRLTSPRSRLLDVLLGVAEPLTAEEVHGRVGSDLSTAYRNLSAFVEAGLVDALVGANGEKRYVMRREGEPGLRLMCLDCGKFLPMPEADLSHVGSVAASQGFDLQTITLAARCAHICDIN